jgi:branched-chain amino acid transport system ATP-binding protein
MSSQEAVLEAVDIEKSFGSVKAVRGVSFSVARGETVAIIGPNGAGKSTLFGVLAGEYRPSSGAVRFEGRDVTSWKASRRCREGMSRTFQVASFFGSRTVRENLVLARIAADGHPLRPWDIFSRGQGRLERVEDVLDDLDLRRLGGVQAQTLAQGDRKRLELAMALVQDPKLLSLDEPTAGMSLDDTGRTIDILRRIKADAPDMSVVFTAHDMDVVFSVSDRVVLMGQGRVILTGTPAEVEAAPETRELYLGVANA